jgi:hypothetical protein
MNPANHILIAADSLEQLRSVDVYRLFDCANPEDFGTLADHINAGRPDMQAEVEQVLNEITQEAA